MGDGRETSRSAHLGLAIRERRQQLGLRKSDVAGACGVSGTRICRMELGHGGATALDAWVAVAGALGMRVDIGSDHRGSSSEVEAVQRLVAATADAGGWAAVRVGADQVLVRGSRREVVVVRIWLTLGDVRAMTTALDEEVARQQASRPAGWRSSGLAVVVQSGATRRRLTEARALVLAWTGQPGAGWLGALRDARARMPARGGLLWANPTRTRLRQTLPLLDHPVRRRHRRPGG